MKFQSISLIAGTQACNASCPFCVSKMTGTEGVEQPQEINRPLLRKAFKLCKMGGVTTAIITGKGEPLLFPDQIGAYIEAIALDPDFPFVELQTNGKLLHERQDLLRHWVGRGLTTVMVSNVGFDEALNRDIYYRGKGFLSFDQMFDVIHEAGAIVRFTTIGIRGGIDSPEKISQLVDWAKQKGVEQISWRPVAKPQKTQEYGAYDWVVRHGLEEEEVRDCQTHVEQTGVRLYGLVHGAAVYDIRGQNFCLTNCLTNKPEEETVRQLIFYPQGRLYTDWQFQGSILLQVIIADY